MNLSVMNPTTLNKVPVKNERVVTHNDVLTVSDRSFRVEFLVTNDTCIRRNFWTKLILIIQCAVVTNRKSYVGFRLQQKSMTLDYLERQFTALSLN